MPEPSSRQASRPTSSAEESRLIPLSIAGVVCFLAAVALGYGGWYFFGTQDGPAENRSAQVTQTAAPSPEATPAATPAATPPSFAAAPAGELPVPGGDVSIGGDAPGNPLRREIVSPFAVAETEVTNEQYRDFIKATGRQAPAAWKDGEFPPGAANEPVTGVSWHDANEYCAWLSEKTGATVRLPTEAEWELAAKGRDNFKYPWGNEWDRRAADSAESGGRVRAVKSFPGGKSPFGAYDMAGNVWEWVADEAHNREGKPKSLNGVTLRIIKGGAATEPQAFISASARYEVPENKGITTLGFRYVIVRARAE